MYPRLFVELRAFFCSLCARIDHLQVRYNALMFAAQEGYLEVVKWLVGKGANVTHRTKLVQFCLCHATLLTC